MEIKNLVKTDRVTIRGPSEKLVNE